MTTTVVSSGVCSGNLGGGVQQASVIVAPRCSLSYSLADLKIQRKIYLPAIDVCCDVFNDFQPSQPTLTSSPIGNGCYFFGFMDPATVARDTSKMAINLDGV